MRNPVDRSGRLLGDYRLETGWKTKYWEAAFSRYVGVKLMPGNSGATIPLELIEFPVTHLLILYLTKMAASDQDGGRRRRVGGPQVV